MVLFLDLLVFALAVVILLTFISQVVAPCYTGEPMFPFFRKSSVKQEIGKAEKELEMLAEAAHLKHIATEIERRKAELEQK
jgi:hypothetical protein